MLKIKHIILGLAFAIGAGIVPAIADIPTTAEMEISKKVVVACANTSAPNTDGVIMHGGGCRKSSPAGQCCHKNHKTGIVHCH